MHQDEWQHGVVFARGIDPEELAVRMGAAPGSVMSPITETEAWGIVLDLATDDDDVVRVGACCGWSFAIEYGMGDRSRRLAEISRNGVEAVHLDPSPDRHDQLVRTVADALTATWPDVERDTGLAQALRANTAALTRHAPEALYQPEAHTVLYRTGESLGATGQVNAAITHFHHLADTAHTRLGPDHPSTLAARSALARWRGEAGDAAGAAAALAELLPDRLRVLGPDHLDILATRHNLAYWRGDAAGAAAATAELLPEIVRVLGPDHPDTLATLATLATRSSLAYWRGKAGDAAGTAAALAELLPDQVRVLGPDHPHTLTTQHEIAQWRGQAGGRGSVR
ncbi:tetratricopeptide repeat protein [Streptomyces nojiriensis]|uniref:tetratricopeptide repeat protein n=1 Tax=Streptomyces nojiriensis TaxID=66374 RepID=UPI00365A2DD4